MKRIVKETMKDVTLKPQTLERHRQASKKMKAHVFGIHSARSIRRSEDGGSTQFLPSS
jgi:hypothetical protein